MSGDSESKRVGKGIDRRKFLQYAGATGAVYALSDFVAPKAQAVDLKRWNSTGTVHVLGCNEMTSTDGYWDNSTPPVLNIKSGDTVYLETGTHLMGKMIPGADINDWMKWYKEVIDRTPETYFFPDEVTGAKKIRKGGGHHHLTGPVYIQEAEPGDILQVEILDIDPGPYAFNLNPTTSFMKLGLLADEYPDGKVRWYAVDRKTMTYDFQDGIRIPIRPFPGTIGVELPEKGMWSNVAPGRHGGNLDNKDLVAGTVLYLPVWVKGAGFKTGDSHLAQGHGEVNLNALEGAFKNITLRFTVRKDLKKLVDWPMASSPTHWIMMGMHTDLYKSSQMAVRQTIDFLNKHYGMPKLEAYAFVSMAVDLHVTQLVDYTLGIHAMIPKGVFIGKQYADKNTLLLPKQA
ncbi:MAG: acetamidase/formamidase family protein [Verrucomicrobiota bacterium]